MATPVETHYTLGKQLIESGCHILFEKPLSLNRVEAEELVNLSNKFNVNLMVGHVLLFHPAIQKIKQLIDSGKTGKIQYIYYKR